MPESRSQPRRILPAASAILLICSFRPSYGELSRQPQDDRIGSASSRVDRFLGRSLEIALIRAADKLRAPKCHSIFSDFTDRGGRPLAETLKATGQSAAQYLYGINFYDGSAISECRPSEVLAVSFPGTRVVYLCGQRFAQTARTQPTVAANILIHEELHSLGLGENPPTSGEINSQVSKKCGS